MQAFLNRLTFLQTDGVISQQIVTLTAELEERDQELDAARAANRELFANMGWDPNTPQRGRADASALVKPIGGGGLQSGDGHRVFECGGPIA
ncbi:hypothetical protein [Nocardia sp. GAS34]|uniref:hypothetical protein n=1 Tax=unclassified Nocardia TaxID=2637762 RepID=UPI003D190C70